MCSLVFAREVVIRGKKATRLMVFALCTLCTLVPEVITFKPRDGLMLGNAAVVTFTFELGFLCHTNRCIRVLSQGIINH